MKGNANLSVKCLDGANMNIGPETLDKDTGKLERIPKDKVVASKTYPRGCVIIPAGFY